MNRVLTEFVSVDQRSPSTDHIAAWEVIRGSTWVEDVDVSTGATAARWLRTICTAREATMNALMKPAATVIELRLALVVE